MFAISIILITAIVTVSNQQQHMCIRRVAEISSECQISHHRSKSEANEVQNRKEKKRIKCAALMQYIKCQEEGRKDPDFIECDQTFDDQFEVALNIANKHYNLECSVCCKSSKISQDYLAVLILTILAANIRNFIGNEVT
ncbi:Uncharacterised protein r2_g3474 [Pycnogonum litorale]